MWIDAIVMYALMPNVTLTVTVKVNLRKIACQSSASMIEYVLLQVNCKCRRVGMADEADSKSVVGNHVWVQVPPTAVI